MVLTLFNFFPSEPMSYITISLRRFALYSEHQIHGLLGNFQGTSNQQENCTITFRYNLNTCTHI